MSAQSDSPKDSALRAVGRTVVNFQRLEHNLKVAARLGPLQGTIHQIQRDVARRTERAETLTLGQALQAWFKYCDGADNLEAWTPDLFDISVSTTFAFEGGSDSLRDHANALRQLLTSRNALIHTRLAHFDWDSDDECSTLVRELDALNALIAEQIESVASLVNQIKAMQVEHANALVAEIEARAQPTPNPSLERP